jgi:hypothetical protein
MCEVKKPYFPLNFYSGVSCETLEKWKTDLMNGTWVLPKTQSPFLWVRDIRAEQKLREACPELKVPSEWDD